MGEYTPYSPPSPPPAASGPHAPVVRLCSRTRWSMSVEMNSPSLPHSASARVSPNAVVLLGTPLSAMLPDVRQVPLPAITYTRDVACTQECVWTGTPPQPPRGPVHHHPVALTCDTARAVQRALTAKSPFGKITPCSMLPSGACVASSPMKVPLDPPLPRNVVMAPVRRSMRRTFKCSTSLTYSTLPLATSPCT
jgi:hypothetical protein